MKVTLLNSNTHVGQNLFNGRLKAAVLDFGATIVTVQEVGRFRARRSMRHQFLKEHWGIFGLVPPVIPGAVGAGNHIIWHKDYWNAVSGDRHLISRQLWNNGRRDKWHPVRRAAQVRLEAVHNENIRLAVGSDHTWTTAGHDWNPPYDRVVKGHRKQCRDSANLMWDARRDGWAVSHNGDYNARIAPGDHHEAYIETQMRSVGMKPVRSKNATEPELDAGFVSQDIEVTHFEWIHNIGSDHPGYVVVLEVTP